MKRKYLTEKARFAFDLLIKHIEEQAKEQLAKCEDPIVKESYKKVLEDLESINEDTTLNHGLIDLMELNANHYIDCQLQLLREIRLLHKKN